MSAKKIGVLTGGGDCPGLNPAIRAIVRTAAQHDCAVVGFAKGWKGALTGETRALDYATIDELLVKGGTVLGTSRTNPYKEEGGPAKIRDHLKRLGLDALIAIGGEDTVGVAAKLFAEGLPVVGLPKTIDNDLNVTDFTLGFPTAVEIVAEAFDRIRTTAESHERVMVVEIMGRHAGWLAAYGGIAGGADAILTPEFPMQLSEIAAILERIRARGRKYALIAVSEGASIVDEQGKAIDSSSGSPVDSFGHVQLGGIGEIVAKMIKDKTGWDTRATNLGHTQRGGTPSAFDRVLSTAFGVRAFGLVREGKYGWMPALVGGRIQDVKLSDATGELKTLSPELYGLARALFG